MPTMSVNKLTSLFPTSRASMRGTKTCKVCGTVNGQRAQVCRNESCEKNKTEKIEPFDPVRLVVVNNGSSTSMYSLRSKLRCLQPRNFVKITEITLSIEANASIVSRNAVCYVDNCKYDAADATEISCKHIKACTLDGTKTKRNLPQAEVYAVSREVLWNLNIVEEQKQRLWKMYKDDEHNIPAVQRLNATTFAVKCTPSKNFAAGRLHVTVHNTVLSKKGAYSCCCKQLKIVVEPDNSVLLENDICDHLLLVLAAILSKPNGKNMYGNFTNALNGCWMPLSLETPLVDNTRDDTLFGMDINIGGNFIEQSDKANADDIFIFSDEFLTDSNIPDFSDVILNLIPNEKELPKSTNIITNPSYNSSADLIHTGDPNLVSSCDLVEDDDIRLRELTQSTNHSTPFGLTSNGEVSTMEETHMELSDCKIELMDQFQLTDQIDLCSNDVALSTDSSNLYDSNAISILPTVAIQQADQTVTFKIGSSPSPISVLTTTTTQPTSIIRQSNNSVSLLKSNQTALLDMTTPLPPIEISVVKKCPIKTSEIVTEVKTRKFPHIPARRDLIVNVPPTKKLKPMPNEPKCLPMAKEPSLSFTAWLDNVIEVINESIVIGQETDVKHTFHVHEEIFSHLSKTFGTGTKLRMYNNLKMMKKGKYKDLMMYTWNFTMASTVRRIFTTPNISLEIERSYVRNETGNFVPYIREPPSYSIVNGSKKRLIYAKIDIYQAFIWFQCSNQVHKTGFKIHWLPNAFPKSHFGVLEIEFSIGIRDPKEVSREQVQRKT